MSRSIVVRELSSTGVAFGVVVDCEIDRTFSILFRGNNDNLGIRSGFNSSLSRSESDGKTFGARNRESCSINCYIDTSICIRSFSIEVSNRNCSFLSVYRSTS